MSYVVMATMTPRKLTPEEGQKILAEMRAAVPANAAPIGWGTINTPGNLSRVEFPQWLHIWLTDAGFAFDTINWFYHLRVPTRKDADAMLLWTMQLRTWAQQNDSEKAAIFERIEVNIHDAGEISEESF